MKRVGRFLRSNRTFMELKYASSNGSELTYNSSNRTFMELKFVWIDYIVILN